MFDPTLLNCLVPNCNDQRQWRNHLFLFCVLLCWVSFCSFVFGVHVDTCIFYFFRKIKREKGCLEGEKLYAWTHMRCKEKKGENKVEKERKQKAIKLLDCYGIFGTRERGVTRDRHYFCKHNHSQVTVKLYIFHLASTSTCIWLF